MHLVADSERMIKVADSDAERLQLGHEARCLRACAHPGVVALIGVEGGEPPDRLILGRLPGGSLAGSSPLTLEVVAGIGAALAATLADLHDLGWAHGAVGAEHVLFDERGGPVLCGFGRAGGPASAWSGAASASASASASAAASAAPPASAEGDVAALAALLRERLPAHADRRLVRLLETAGGRRRWSRPVDARQLARRIVEAVPAARLAPPGEPDAVSPESEAQTGGTGGVPGGRPHAQVSRRWVAVAGGVGFAGLVAVVAFWSLGAGRGAGPGAVSSRTPAGVQAMAAAPRSGMRVSGRYLLTEPAGEDLVSVIGRWGCGADRLATLDIATGWVWVFDGWPVAGRTLTGHPVLRRPAATGLAVRAVNARCDSLAVLSRAGAVYVVPETRLGTGQ